VANIELGNPIAGAMRGYQVAGAPVAGTNEVQTLTIDATGGTFQLSFQGFTTAAISWNATNGTLNPNNPFAAAGQTAQVLLRSPYMRANETSSRALRGVVDLSRLGERTVLLRTRQLRLHIP